MTHYNPDSKPAADHPWRATNRKRRKPAQRRPTKSVVQRFDAFAKIIRRVNEEIEE